MTANGSGIAEGGGFLAQKFNLAGTKFECLGRESDLTIVVLGQVFERGDLENENADGGSWSIMMV